ncbi:MAG: tryptophan--tRNA ligase [Clostridia bacterium]|nr:tryptophan--tRNA ligase [Clostridia bacterium]MBO7689652.1 tryptophan--tRNA ligase [Clostridia bacterium]MBP5272778.1 tryptophan--tRNA ligase [Clostridia bacterium]MBP5459590.1 tryptophan--tRNA ligase [Clostridia bacterium]
MEEQKRVLSLIQPSGVPTLGNYLGALKNWSDIADEFECAFGVADLHAITVRQDPQKLRKQVADMYALLLALGLNPEKNIVFVQSQVPTHAQLGWILDCYTQFGEMSRMTQFKDKSQQHADNVNVGLFAYPALMAADILLYQAHYVPVGADQKQHLEITRDIANRFNGIYGDVFTVPEPLIRDTGARIMSLQDPAKKMSKSDPNPKSYVSIFDEPNVIAKKIRSAVTDSEAEVRFAEGKDGVNNLMSIYSCCTGATNEQIEAEFAGKGYGDFKNAVADAVIASLEPLQSEFKRVSSDRAYLEQCMKEGAERATYVSSKTLNKVMKKVGFYQFKK